MVERVKNADPTLAPAARPVRAVIGFDLHSNSTEYGYYSGVGKLQVQGEPGIRPISVSYLHVHQDADDGSFAATLHLDGAESLGGLPAEFDIHGKLQPPALTLAGDKGELADGALHKGDVADFDRLARSLDGHPAR